MKFSEQDIKDLRYARNLLEHPSLAIRITNIVGTPIEKGFELLPASWSEVVNQATRTALQRALDLVLTTMGEHGPVPSKEKLHKLFVAATGAGGGAFGLAGVPIELPVSTMLILRSIADVARSEGEKIKSLETRLACIEVFALGGRSTGDDAAETGYFAVRAALAKTVSEAAQYIAEHGVVEKTAPAIMRLITQIANRFSVTVSEKVAAQAIPIVGAAGGAILNLVFIDHFQDMARGHFIVRRLERSHGPDSVREEYKRLTV
jgi:hypothetical protein